MTSSGSTTYCGRVDPPANPVDSAPRRRGRPPKMSRAEIIDAALAVGFRDLTVVAVADHLNVRHTSLYTHISGYDDLCAAALQQVFDDVTWPDQIGGWRAYLWADAMTVWDQFARHPGMGAVLRKTRAFPEGVRTHFAAGLNHLVGCGFSEANAVLTLDTLYHLASDSMSHADPDGPTSTDAGTPDAGPVDARPPDAEQWVRHLDSPLAGSVQRVFDQTPLERFTAKLELLLDGAELRLQGANGDQNRR